MDIAVFVQALAPKPVTIDTRAVVFMGAFLPIPLPLAALPPAEAARFACEHTELALADRVSIALASGAEDLAWRTIMSSPGSPAADHRLSLILAHWQAKQLVDCALRLDGRPVLVVRRDQADDTGDWSVTASGSVDDITNLFSGLPWPRWVGPVLIVLDQEPIAGLPAGATRLARPVLPVLRMDPRVVGIPRMEACADAMSRLVLECSAPPPRGWPAWLRVGVAGVARAIARGEGPSPMAMLAIRHQAGRTALLRLLQGGPADPGLSTALCAPLMVTTRRYRFGNLLDLLRNGARSGPAIAIAYGLTIDQLLDAR